ncbi:MAG: sensor histidine kinase [Chloroflexota bacterium]
MRVKLRTKLFISYLAVVFIGAVTLLVGMLLVTPLLYERLVSAMMAGMMGGATGMMAEMMRGMTATIEAAVGRTFVEIVTYSLAVSSAVSVVVALLASLFVARRVVAPIQRLSAASQRLAAGHYAERVEVRTGDEVGDLAHAFNQMATALEETERRRLALIADVAHELRTPLATIEGYTEGLVDGVVEPTLDTFNLLHREADRLRRLVDDLQELSRAEAGQIVLKRHPIAPEALVQEVRDRLAPQFAAKGTSLVVTLPPPLPQVLADEGRVVQVLTNLVGNALRYTPSGGRVEVSARLLGGKVEFVVTDSGAGIAPQDLAHVFERFYRADRSRSRAGGGSGIGLTIAKHLVEAHGGEIGAESPGLGRGATFYFALPITSAATKARASLH